MPALHPTMPAGYYRVFGGLAVTRAGRTLLGADTGTQVTVWDADTGNRITDLIGDDGVTSVSATVVGQDGVIAPVGIPTSVLRPLFQVGESGVFLPPGSDSPSAVTLDAAQSSAADATTAAIEAKGYRDEAQQAAQTVSGAVQPGDLVYNLADYASLQAAIDAAPSGATVYVPAGNFPTGTTLINKPLTLTGPGTLRASGNGELLQITSSNVRLIGLTLTGPGLSGNDYVDGSNAVHAIGTSSAPISGLVIDGCTITGWLDSGLWLEWPASPRIVNNRIADIIYAGVMTLSQKGGVISGNTVENITQGSAGLVVNSYGIAVSDIENTLAGRAENVTIANNFVKGVPNWEGIDTHGGLNITVTGNVVIGCRSSIAMVSGNTTRVVAPTNVVVTGNVVDSTGAPSTTGGISLFGVSSSGAKASGVIVGNTFRGSFSSGRINLGYFDTATTEFDDWCNYTPTWTGLTFGNATKNCAYTRVGNTVTVTIQVVLGSTSAVTGLIDFTLPVPPAPEYEAYTGMGSGVLSDVSQGGTGHYAVTPFLLTLGSGGRVYFLYNNSQVTNSFFAWAAGDKITATLTYECATASP